MTSKQAMRCWNCGRENGDLHRHSCHLTGFAVGFVVDEDCTDPYEQIKVLREALERIRDYYDLNAEEYRAKYGSDLTKPVFDDIDPEQAEIARVALARIREGQQQ